jgi:hypothetical protein
VRRTRAGSPGAPSRKRRLDAEPQEPERPSVPGAAHAIIIDRIADEGLVVHFENGPGVPLGEPGVVYDTLLALCAGTSCSNAPSGGLVPFKTAAELAAGLGGITRHCLCQRISRLWLILRRFQHGHLFESGPQGYRIRLLLRGQIVDRSKGGVIEDG